MDNKIGYRYEHSIKPDRDAISVLTFETWELCNIDVLYYLCNVMYKCFSEPLMYKLSCLLEAMGHGGEKPKGYSELDINLIYRNVLYELGAYYKKDFFNGCAVWLCDSIEDDYESYVGFVCDEDTTFEEFKRDVSKWKKGLQITENEEEGNLYLYSYEDYQAALLD